MKLLYSRLGFKVNKDFSASHHFEKARKGCHYESGKSKALQKKIGLQCYQTIPRHVKILHENQIDFKENKYVFKYLNEVPPWDDSFPYKYIDAGFNKKLDKTKGRIAGNEMEKENKHHMESLNHDPKWLNTITIEIDKFLINFEYINFLINIYMKLSKDNGSTSSSWTLIIQRLPGFDKLALSQFQLYIVNQTTTQCFCCRNFKKTILVWSDEGKDFFVFYTC